METHASVDAYIESFPEDIQIILREVRSVAQKAAPEATEKISYGIPTLHFHGNLVHFAAFKNHIGLYPTPSGIVAFKEELLPYESGKGTVKFPLDKPIPYSLITKIVRHRVKENEEKYEK